MNKKIVYYINLGLIFFIYALSLWQPVDFTVQDLGRHIVNGRAVLAGQRQILKKNVYSYTMPEQSFVNHHWLGGVVFALIFDHFGINALSIFSIAIALTTLAIFLLIIYQKSNSTAITIILGLIGILFLADRSEIRPEIFGYLFIAHCLWQIHYLQKNGSLKIWQIKALVLQQLLWVNLHISFVFAFLIIGLKFMVSAWFDINNQLSTANHNQPKKQKFTNSKQLGFLLILLITVSLLNPNGMAGLLAPANIFTDYGYPIVENKSLYFLYKVIALPTLFTYLVVLLLELVIFFAKLKMLTNNKQQLTSKSYFWIALAMIGAILAFLAKRNQPIFALFTLPLMAECLASLKNSQFFLWLKNILRPQQLQLSLLLTLILSLPLLISGVLTKRINYHNRYLGFVPEQFSAIEFFNDLKIEGNIFNNYDIGSYLIYGLYPEKKVFVDNRPEAYTSQFFQKTYIPMQENEQLWQQMLERYQFSTIFFGTRDLTNWGQKFLYNRLNDPAWKVVFHNYYAVILVRE